MRLPAVVRLLLALLVAAAVHLPGAALGQAAVSVQPSGKKTGDMRNSIRFHLVKAALRRRLDAIEATVRSDDFRAYEKQLPAIEKELLDAYNAQPTDADRQIVRNMALRVVAVHERMDQARSMASEWAASKGKPLPEDIVHRPSLMESMHRAPDVCRVPHALSLAGRDMGHAGTVLVTEYDTADGRQFFRSLILGGEKGPLKAIVACAGKPAKPLSSCGDRDVRGPNCACCSVRPCEHVVDDVRHVRWHILSMTAVVGAYMSANPYERFMGHEPKDAAERRFLVNGIGVGSLPALLARHFADARMDILDEHADVISTVQTCFGFPTADMDAERVAVHHAVLHATPEVAGVHEFRTASRYDAVLFNTIPGVAAVIDGQLTRRALEAAKARLLPGGIVAAFLDVSPVCSHWVQAGMHAVFDNAVEFRVAGKPHMGVIVAARHCPAGTEHDPNGDLLVEPCLAFHSHAVLRLLREAMPQLDEKDFLIRETVGSAMPYRAASNALQALAGDRPPHACFARS